MNKRFLLFGSYGLRNVGDEAMLYVSLEQLGAFFPEAHFSVVAQGEVTVPSSVRHRTSLVRRTVGSILWQLSVSDSLVRAGGLFLCDFVGSRRGPRTLFKTCSLLLAAKILRTKVSLLGVGAGPIYTRLGRLLARPACSLVDYAIVRDKVSYDLLCSLGMEGRVSLGFDVAALLSPVGEQRPSSPTVNGQPRVLGVSVVPFFKRFYHDRRRDNELMDRFVEPIKQYLKADGAREVRLFIFGGDLKEGDIGATELLKQGLAGEERVEVVPHDPDPGRMLSRVAECDIFLGMRLHSCFFAYCGNVPFLMVAYHPKCRAIASEIGLPQEAVISVSDIMDGRLGERFKLFCEEPRSFSPSVPPQVSQQKIREALLQFSGKVKGSA